MVVDTTLHAILEIYRRHDCWHMLYLFIPDDRIHYRTDFANPGTVQVGWIKYRITFPHGFYRIEKVN